MFIIPTSSVYFNYPSLFVGWNLDDDDDHISETLPMLVYNDIKHSDDTLLRLNTLRKGSEFCDTILEVRELLVHPSLWQIFKKKRKCNFTLNLDVEILFVVYINLFYPRFFQIEGHEVNAHRAILACASPFLFEMFSTESNAYQLDWKHHYKLENVDYDSFIILLNFIYTARLVANTGYVIFAFSATVSEYDLYVNERMLR